MKKKIILASASPRRQELLTQIGLDFEVHPSDWEEKTEKELPGEVVQELSFHKAMEVYHRLQAGAGESLAEESLVVIGADTIVACQGQILGKPGDKERRQGCCACFREAFIRSIPAFPWYGRNRGKQRAFLL